VTTTRTDSVYWRQCCRNHLLTYKYEIVRSVNYIA